jgi:hypothetical protein
MVALPLLLRVIHASKARAIPDDHPVIPQLNDLFGEHTFFLDRKGLNIVEPAEAAAGAAAQSAKVVNSCQRRRPDWSRASRA